MTLQMIDTYFIHEIYIFYHINPPRKFKRLKASPLINNQSFQGFDLHIIDN